MALGDTEANFADCRSGLIFGVVGQFIAIFVGVAETDASAVFVLIGYIIGGIIGNMLYDRGVG